MRAMRALRAIAHPSAIGSLLASDVAPHFRDRADAGARLAERLTSYRGQDTLVLGIPRGGVPVAAVVAQALGAELDVVVARKLRSPISAELAIGAVTADGGRFLNDAMVQHLQVDEPYVDRVTQAETAEASRRESRFRAGAAAPRMTRRTVILVDDGLATGATMIAAARSARAHNPARLIIAVPVGSAEACKALRHESDEVVCLYAPEPFWAVGAYYDHFTQVEDDEVDLLLREARQAPHAVATTGVPLPGL